ncbi:MAG: hypothetical protein DYG94_09110 [Leptolyngbya sp. PLA3]|nr:hypothetical protein [Leptolyngbya sp. PL-A3]
MRVLAKFVSGADTTVIKSLDGSRLGAFCTANLIDTGMLPEKGGEPLVCWSGWLGDSDPGEGWFESVPGQWLPSSRAAWDQVCRVADQQRLILRPHARHLLSDGPGCLNWLRGNEGRRLLLDPVAMLEPGMLPDAEDHVSRLLMTVGPLAWGLVVSDVGVRETPQRGRWCVPVPAGSGSIDMNRFLELIGKFVPETCVLVGQNELAAALLEPLA